MIKMVSLIVLFCWQAKAETIEITSQNIKSLLDAKSAKVLASKTSVEAAKEREGFLLRSYLPSAELYGAQESFKAGSAEQKTQPQYGGEVKVNLFNGGKDKIEDEVRDLETKKKTYETQRVMAEESEKARTLYWQILFLQEKTGLLKSALDVNVVNLQAAHRRIKSGVATESDRVEFEMKEVDLKREQAETEIQLRSQTRNLMVMLDLDSKDRVLFPEKMGHEHDVENLFKHISKDHEFLFKENEIASEQSSLMAKSNGRSWWPKLDAYAGYNQYNRREKEFPNATDRTETVFGLRMSLSLPAGFEANQEAAAKNKESVASRTLALYQKNETEAHIENELEELRLMHNQVHDAEENIKRAERYYKLTQSEYSRGVKNSPDVLGAAEKLFDMREKRIEIVRKFQISKVHVLSKLGR